MHDLGFAASCVWLTIIGAFLRWFGWGFVGSLISYRSCGDGGSKGSDYRSRDYGPFVEGEMQIACMCANHYEVKHAHLSVQA